jgi:hypothetical protein
MYLEADFAAGEMTHAQYVQRLRELQILERNLREVMNRKHSDRIRGIQ